MSSVKQWNSKVEQLAGKIATDEADLKQLVKFVQRRVVTSQPWKRN